MNEYYHEDGAVGFDPEEWKHLDKRSLFFSYNIKIPLILPEELRERMFIAVTSYHIRMSYEWFKREYYNKK